MFLHSTDKQQLNCSFASFIIVFNKEFIDLGTAAIINKHNYLHASLKRLHWQADILQWIWHWNIFHLNTSNCCKLIYVWKECLSLLCSHRLRSLMLSVKTFLHLRFHPTVPSEYHNYSLTSSKTQSQRTWIRLFLKILTLLPHMPIFSYSCVKHIYRNISLNLSA